MLRDDERKRFNLLRTNGEHKTAMCIDLENTSEHTAIVLLMLATSARLQCPGALKKGHGGLATDVACQQDDDRSQTFRNRTSSRQTHIRSVLTNKVVRNVPQQQHLHPEPSRAPLCDDLQ
jgi:hypothetical protein